MQIQNSPQWQVGKQRFPDLQQAASEMLGPDRLQVSADLVAEPLPQDLEQAERLRAQSQDFFRQAETAEVQTQRAEKQSWVGIGLLGLGAVGLCASAAAGSAPGVLASSAAWITGSVIALAKANEASEGAWQGLEARLQGYDRLGKAQELESPLVLQSGLLTRLGEGGPQGVVFVQPDQPAQFIASPHR